MGYVNSTPEDDLRLDATARANPITRITPNNWYDGLAGAVPRGVAGAFVKTENLIGDMLGVGPMDNLKPLEEWSKPDARYQAQPAQVIQGVTEGLGLAASGSMLGGPLGAAAMLGGVEGYATYREQREADVDKDTAMKVAGVTGITNALGVFLPMAVTKSAVTGILGRAMAAEAEGNTTLARVLYSVGEAAAPAAEKATSAVALGVGTNVLSGMAQRGLTGEILRSNGYHDMAEQYRVWDAQSMIADVILGAAFGGLAHITSPDRVPPSMVDDAMAFKKQEHFDRAGVGIPTNPLAANVHHDVMGRSIEDLIMGKPGASLSTDEAAILTRDVVADPEIEMMQRQQLDALANVYDGYTDMGTPTLLPEPPKPVIEPAAPTPPTPPKAEGEAAPSAKINPLAQETLTQLATRNPDMLVQLGDGREVRVADLPTILEENMAAAQKDSVLHDVAAACYIRTTL